MAGGRPGSEGTPREAAKTVPLPERGATVPLEPPSGPTRTQLQMHVAIAKRMLEQGNAPRAFQELVRASRLEPMTPRLAAAVTRYALEAKAVAQGAAVLQQGVGDVEDEDRRMVLRSLARLHRRAGDLDASSEVLVQVLAERPGDARARAVLNAVLERQQLWAALDASLERQLKDALERGAMRLASRVSLKRGRIQSERLGDPGRAALRYGEAADCAEQARDFESAFLLRLLWLRSLHRSGSPKRALEDAVAKALVSARRVGRADKVLAMGRELGVTLTESGAKATVPLPPPAEEVTPPSSSPPRRRSTQLELMAVAEAAQTAGHGPEVTAVLAAAVAEGPHVEAERKLEAHLIARGAWRELAQFYRDASARSASTADKASWLTRLAELLETELDDVIGAAKAWAEVVSLTGDAGAVTEQVRLLGTQRDAAGVKDALDHGVSKATDDATRARALVLRAEEAMAREDSAAAQRDFGAALKLAPGDPHAAAGYAEVVVPQGDLSALTGLNDALKKLKKRSPGRGDLYRRLARLAEGVADDAELARDAWREVAAELKGDEEAEGRLLALAHALGDDAALEELLRARAKSEARGEKAREARMAMLEVLERQGRGGEAVEWLAGALLADPGHLEAWLALAQRYEQREQWADAGLALEQAAQATGDTESRLRLWRRLERLHRLQLGDDERADVFAERVERIEAELGLDEPGRLPGGPLVIPKPRRSAGGPPAPSDFDAVAEAMGARVEPDEPADAPPVPLPQRIRRQLAELQEAHERGELLAPQDRTRSESDQPISDVMEVRTADIELVQEELVRASAGDRRTQELPAQQAELGDPAYEIPPSFGPSPSRALSLERQALFEHVRQNPLDAEGYKMLAEHFDVASDPGRSSLMLELARALEGDPDAAPRTPRLILSQSDRAGLKHPLLRGEQGELMALVGIALCRLYPAQGRDATASEELRLDSGKGAKASADALLAGVRVLGIRAPDVFVSEDPGPPFSVAYAGQARVLVGRGAVKKVLNDAELRFFSGRALFTLQPELLSLRTLRREQIYRGLVVVGQVLQGRPLTAEGRVVRDAIAPRSWERLKALYQKVQQRLDVTRIAEGARHSANRAGLVVCGGVAPAIAALKAKRALPQEVMELVRFAASERYLELRSRRLGRG